MATTNTFRQFLIGWNTRASCIDNTGQNITKTIGIPTLRKILGLVTVDVRGTGLLAMTETSVNRYGLVHGWYGLGDSFRHFSLANIA